ncbi:MAG TPA: hypothetical protein EYM79_12230 [Planctomycetes bacterium]|nr:hypothetical protein [Planctomycetaceae bacterium]HIN55069.1 hypothetical protein [Planctomycetota bacterium]
MVTKIIPISLGKRLSCGFALSGILLSAGVFGLATAENKDAKVSKAIRILLTDDTPDATLSIRRKPADQRNLDKLYNNELRPTKAEPKKVVEAEVKSAPQAEIVTPETLSPKTETPTTIEQVKEMPQTKTTKNGLDSVLTTLTLPKFDLWGDIDAAFNAIENELSSATKSSADNSPANNHKSKLRPTHSNHDSKDHASPSLSTIPSIDTLLPKIELPKFDLFGDIDAAFNAIEDELSSATKSSADNSSANNHKSKLKQTHSNRDPKDHASPSLSTIPSIDTWLPKIELSKVDFLGDIESAFIGIGTDLSTATTSTTSQYSSKYNSKVKHPGSFTPRHVNRATAAPVHMPTIGSLDGIQFPKIMLADINSIFGTNTDPLVDEDGKTPTAVPAKLPEQTNERAKDSDEDKQGALPVKERLSIIALLGLEDLAIPEFNNPFAVGTGIKETSQDVEPVETKNTSPALGESDLEPDETITSELPSLHTERPAVPGVNQIPTLAPKKIPDAPNPIDDQDKSASRMSPYKTLVNPDSFLPRRSVVPVSVRISDTVNR